MKKIVTTSSTETKKFAEKFAKTLKGGEVIGLIGELGSGKTTFVQGLAKGLGVKHKIHSPTFILMRVVPITNYKLPITQLVHVDAYRVEDEHELWDIGLEDYLGNPETVTVIEWADRITLPKHAKKILFSGEKESRTIQLL